MTTTRRGPAATIEFLCRAEDRGVIAEPVPARSVLPDWFRSLKGVDAGHLSATNDGVTVKRCLPFLDAMSTGWIMPLAATVRLEVTDDGKHVEAGWEFDRVMVSNHSPFQVAGNPHEPRPPMKFHNYWTVKTAPGWSCLFIPPLNRSNPVFQALSGVVDTDEFATPVNFPFITTAGDGVHVLPKGTPVVQVIPFRRGDAAIASTIGTTSIRPESDGEKAARRRIHRAIAAGASWYRNNARAAR
jgi:Family of unknown function (DUF6065)